MKVFTIIALLIIAAVPVFSAGQTEDQNEMDNTMMMESDESMDSEMSPFIEFKDSGQAMMLAEEKPTVLFFNASWCPTCKAAREDFTAHAADLTGINLVLVDYDNSDALQMKYGVTYQHTFVQIAADGTAISTWNGGATKELLEHTMMKEM